MNQITNGFAVVPRTLLSSSSLYPVAWMADNHPVTSKTQSSRVLPLGVAVDPPAAVRRLRGDVVSLTVAAIGPRLLVVGKERIGMARIPREAEITLDEAEEAQSAIQAALDYGQRAMADGAVTPDEAHEWMRRLQQAVKETQDVVTQAERTTVAELASIAWLTGGPGRNLQRRMRDVGLDNMLHFPAPDANSAA